MRIESALTVPVSFPRWLTTEKTTTEKMTVTGLLCAVPGRSGRGVPKPVEPKPVEPKAVEPKPAGPKPVDRKPADRKSADRKVIDRRPGAPSAPRPHPGSPVGPQSRRPWWPNNSRRRSGPSCSP